MYKKLKIELGPWLVNDGIKDNKDRAIFLTDGKRKVEVGEVRSRNWGTTIAVGHPRIKSNAGMKCSECGRLGWGKGYHEEDFQWRVGKRDVRWMMDNLPELDKIGGLDAELVRMGLGF